MGVLELHLDVGPVIELSLAAMSFWEGGVKATREILQNFHPQLKVDNTHCYN